VKTKQAILQTALSLFNKKGIDAITVRHIAAEMNISHGNLCYHYPNKKTIIHTLYLQLVEEIDSLMRQLQTKELDLAMLLESNSRSFDVFFRYRFLFLDFTHIMRDNPDIRKHYRLLYKRRKEEFKWLIEHLVKAGIFRKAPVSGAYESLVDHVFIFADFWMPSSEVLYEGRPGERIPHYRKILQMLIVPYLTEAGMKSYKQIIKKK